ncbi:MAG: hypothetical protein LBK99_17385 [Opitutaceae bacterium]|nr:hypothetical protein [Opitutaceae bacterium]
MNKNVCTTTGAVALEPGNAPAFPPVFAGTSSAVPGLPGAAAFAPGAQTGSPCHFCHQPGFRSWNR